MEFLKALFADGALTFDELLAKVNTAGLKVVDVNKGEYVSKEKHERLIADKTEEVESAKAQIAEASAKIESFKSLDVEGIKASADEWKKKAEELELKNQEQEYKRQVENLIANEKFSSISAKKAFLSELYAQELKISNGTLIGYTDFRKSYAELDPNAFASDTTEPTKIPPTQTKANAKSMTKAEFNKLTFKDKMIYKAENPELYKAFLSK